MKLDVSIWIYPEMSALHFIICSYSKYPTRYEVKDGYLATEVSNGSKK